MNIHKRGKNSSFSPISLQRSIFEQKCRLVANFPTFGVADHQTRIWDGIPSIAKGRVTLIVEAGVGQIQTSNESPDVIVLPGKDGVDPHQFWPVRVCRRKLILGGCVWVTGSSAQNGGLDVWSGVQHSLEAFFHGPPDTNDILRIVIRTFLCISVLRIKTYYFIFQ